MKHIKETNGDIIYLLWIDCVRLFILLYYFKRKERILCVHICTTYKFVEEAGTRRANHIDFQFSVKQLLLHAANHYASAHPMQRTHWTSFILFCFIKRQRHFRLCVFSWQTENTRSQKCVWRWMEGSLSYRHTHTSSHSFIEFFPFSLKRKKIVLIGSPDLCVHVGHRIHSWVFACL